MDSLVCRTHDQSADDIGISEYLVRGGKALIGSKTSMEACLWPDERWVYGQAICRFMSRLSLLVEFHSAVFQAYIGTRSGPVVILSLPIECYVLVLYACRIQKITLLEFQIILLQALHNGPTGKVGMRSVLVVFQN